jgi:hypothetical protein
MSISILILINKNIMDKKKNVNMPFHIHVGGQRKGVR